MSLVFLIRFSYAALACIALSFELAPWTREAFVKYGRTRSQPGVTTAQIPGARSRASTGSSWSAAALRIFASWTVPKNLFSQFYCVGAIASGLLTIDAIAWCNSQASPELAGTAPRLFVHRYMDFEQQLFGSTQTTVPAVCPSKLAVLALVLFTTHVLIRLKECIYDQPATDARMHVGQYAVGILFYALTPLATTVDAYHAPGWELQSSWMVPAGLAIYIYASIHQRRCHQILYELRHRCLDKKHAETVASGESGESGNPADNYAIPTGDLFSYVSCPHFLCEILIYISIWMVTACQATTLLWVVGWTAINLGITARESQQWYQTKFGARYPRARRALVPLVW
ncbi:hypothetical protein IWW38_001054 [Coemansia aciculifera]|uniref:Uncharacterized protein n=1 Tax=Coemansia aciculifera TaxID=417176 RepID=A0ACC1M876_9FUNG|nr:hypothetical protein IWW38_001054 [Coemansia aciculifera]